MHRDLTNCNIAWNPKEEPQSGVLVPGAVGLVDQAEASRIKEQFVNISGACESDVVGMSFENRVDWLRRQLTKMRDLDGIDLRQAHPVLLGLAEYRAMVGHDDD